jgi:nitroreductase
MDADPIRMSERGELVHGHQDIDHSEKNSMNSVIEVIRKRKSVRLYENKPIPREIIETIVEAAHNAPFMSDKRYQPWRFVVVQDQEFKQQVVQTVEPVREMFVGRLKDTQPEGYERAMKQYAINDPEDLIFYSAPTVIYVIAPAVNSVGSAMVCENIMIAADSYGLGSCYVGFGSLVTGNPEVVQALELTKDERIYGPVILGYPKANPNEIEASTLAELRPLKKEPRVKWI